MAQFIYYLPKFERHLAVEADLVAAGLKYAISQLGIDTNFQSVEGPDGSGLFLVTQTHAGTSPPARYAPDCQTWRKGPDGNFWVGFWNDAKPTPEELAREHVIAGHPVKLRDGNEWIVPVARSIVRGSTLPKGLILGDDAKTWELSELPEFVAICHDATTVWESIRQGKEMRMPFQEAARIVCDALAINYRIGPVEASMLGLLDETAAWGVMEALVDMPTVLKTAEEHERKNSPAAG